MFVGYPYFLAVYVFEPFEPMVSFCLFYSLRVFVALYAVSFMRDLKEREASLAVSFFMSVSSFVPPSFRVWTGA